ASKRRRIATRGDSLGRVTRSRADRVWVVWATAPEAVSNPASPRIQVKPSAARLLRSILRSFMGGTSLLCAGLLGGRLRLMRQRHHGLVLRLEDLAGGPLHVLGRDFLILGEP